MASYWFFLASLSVIISQTISIPFGPPPLQEQCASNVEKPKDQLLLQFSHTARLQKVARNFANMSNGDCCTKCGSFCSQGSGNCYNNKAKDYYQTCDPQQPRKRIEINNRQLLVDGRPLHIKGICWGPTPKGQKNHADYSGSVEKDAKLMQEAGINVVRTYGTLADRSVLDALWAKGIWVVPTVYAWGGNDPSVVIEAVNAVKDHPAILMWTIGNEWNYNGIYVHLTKWESVHKLNQAAQLIKENDNEHPVASIYGEVPETDIIHAMPNVDLWGINSYRGISHGGLFDDYARRTGKPMFMGEYGADAFNARVNAEDQGAQAHATKELTREIVERSSVTGGDVLGGFLFEFNDEWWKDGAGNNWVHDVGGIAPGGGPYPDKTFNEEWWGIVDIDRNPRAAYWEYRASPNPTGPPHANCCGSCEGHAYCSPESGSCYDTKMKDYYEKCFAHDDCCNSCGGLGFCSPLSGTCYEAKAKDYYFTCGAAVADCCSSCGGKSHCSPLSGACHDSKAKDYYLTCAA